MTPLTLLMFNLFPNLPQELQNMIWRRALPGPRVIQVHRHHSRYSTLNFTGAHPPALLHTCQGSREVALKVFDAAFTHNNMSTNKALSPIYINFAHDTIHLTMPCKFGFKALVEFFPDTRKIQSLAVEVSGRFLMTPTFIDIIFPVVKLKGDPEGDLKDITEKFEADLREIIVVVRHKSHPLYGTKYPENVRFSEPEAMPWSPWQTWKHIESHWTERFSQFCERGVVRFMEVEMV